MSSSTSRNDNEYRRYQRTAQRMSAGSVCRHLKIVGRVAISRFFHVVSPGPTEVATQPIRCCQLFLIKEKQVSLSTYIQTVCALRFFHTRTVRRKITIE